MKLDSKVFKIISILILTFIPIRIKTITNTANGSIEENIYYLFWLILIHLQPNDNYVSDQWIVTGFPWSFFIFTPTLYIISVILDKQSKNSELRVIFLCFLQVMVLYIMTKSQLIYYNNVHDFVEEEVNYNFTPQLIISIIYILKLLFNFKNKNQD